MADTEATANTRKARRIPRTKRGKAPIETSSKSEAATASGADLKLGEKSAFMCITKTGTEKTTVLPTWKLFASPATT
jgi:hypothetical protein